MGLKIVSYKEYICDYKGHQEQLDGPRTIKNGRTVHVFSISNQPTKVMCGKCYSGMNLDLLSQFFGATYNAIVADGGVKNDQAQRREYDF